VIVFFSQVPVRTKLLVVECRLCHFVAGAKLDHRERLALMNQLHAGETGSPKNSVDPADSATTFPRGASCKGRFVQSTDGFGTKIRPSRFPTHGSVMPILLKLAAATHWSAVLLEPDAVTGRWVFPPQLHKF
jgi:hypothetical protein